LGQFLGPAHFHDLRHTCASLLITGHKSIKFTQQQMRHASAQMTLDTYAHLMPSDAEEAIEYLSKMIVR